MSEEQEENICFNCGQDHGNVEIEWCSCGEHCEFCSQECDECGDCYNDCQCHNA